MKVSNNLPPLRLQSKKNNNPDDVEKQDRFSSSILSSSNKMAPAPSGPIDSEPPNKPITRSTASAWTGGRSNVDFLYSNKMEKTRFESDPAWMNTVLGPRPNDAPASNGGTKPGSNDFDRLTTVLGPHTNNNADGN